MGKLPSQVTGKSYTEAYNRLVDAAERANGMDPYDLADGSAGFVPRLRNGEAVAILQGWRRAAARGKVKWPWWYELTIFGLGWRTEGDKFDMSSAHRKGWYPTEMLELLWRWTGVLASDLDKAGTVVRPIVIDQSTSAYERSARDAWETMKLDRKIPGRPGEVIDVEDPQPFDPERPPVTGPPPVGGFPWWLLVVGAALVMRKRRKR